MLPKHPYHIEAFAALLMLIVLDVAWAADEVKVWQGDVPSDAGLIPTVASIIGPITKADGLRHAKLHMVGHIISVTSDSTVAYAVDCAHAKWQVESAVVTMSGNGASHTTSSAELGKTYPVTDVQKDEISQAIFNYVCSH